MKRSILLALAALALAAGLIGTAAAGAAAAGLDGAHSAQKGKAKAKTKAGKKKAAKCKTAKRKGKAKGKRKARKSALADGAAKRKAKGKGKRKAKRNCGKAKPKRKATGPQRRFERVRAPHEQKLLDRYRERREEMEERRQNAPKPLTNEDVAPADGTYTSASAPGLTVTVSGNSTQARVLYTVSPDAFDETCRPHTTGESVDITGPIEISHSTQRGHLMLHASQPVDASVGAHKSQSVTGSIGKDGSFALTISASFPFPTDLNATCSSFPPPQLTGTLAK